MRMAQHDRAPIPFETNADLTGATVPRLFAYDVVKQVVVELTPVTIPTPANGRISWAPDGNTPPGSYDLEAQVTVGTLPVTYPSDNRDRPRLDIFADLG